MANSANSKKPSSLGENEVLQGLYEAEHRPSQDQKWAAIEASKAPFARAVIVRAQQIREEGIDAGDAYLMGIADANEHDVRLRSIDELAQGLSNLPETPEPSTSS